MIHLSQYHRNYFQFSSNETIDVAKTKEVINEQLITESLAQRKNVTDSVIDSCAAPRRSRTQHENLNHHGQRCNKQATVFFDCLSREFFGREIVYNRYGAGRRGGGFRRRKIGKRYRSRPKSRQVEIDDVDDVTDDDDQNLNSDDGKMFVDTDLF